jgi:hypothetical protein
MFLVDFSIDDLPRNGGGADSYRAVGFVPKYRVINDATRRGVASLVSYWRSKHRNAELPRREQIELHELRSLGRNIMILEPADTGNDWRWRLAGTAISERYEFEFTGKTVRDVFDPAAVPEVLSLLQKASEGSSPITVSGHLHRSRAEHTLYECVLLPILASEGRARWILSGVFFE